MGEALGDEEFAKVDARKRVETTLADMRAKGVREGSLRIVEGLLRADASATPFGETGGGWTYDPVAIAYTPEIDTNGNVLGDEPAILKRRLASQTPPTLEVRFRAADGRDEAVAFPAIETKRYLEGDLRLQETMRTFAVRERRLRTAIAVAGKLREAGGRRAEIELGGANQLTPDQELCLREFAGVTTATKYSREGGVRTAREAIVLREGWHTKAARALREGTRDLDPRALREDWGFDDDLASEQEPRARIGGLVGPGNRSDYAAASRLNIVYGPNEQQMLVSEVWNEQWKARTAYATDPFCKQGVRISSNFVLGRGLSVTAPNPAVQAVLDEYDGRHSQASKKKHLRSALVMGELFLWRQPLTNGRVRHVKLPAQTIWGIVTVAGDPTIPIAYIQRFWTRFQEFADPDNQAKYIERIIPANEVIHWKLNAEEDEVRGRSETYAALPWHLKYRNHWEAQIEKDYATAAYAYVAFVEGTDAQVRQFTLNNVPRHRPRPGHTRVFNTKVKSFNVVSSDKNSPSGQGSTSEGILNALSANYGFAKEYFGVDGNRTRGGAVTSAGPAEKSFEDRQDDFGEVVRQCYQDAIDAAAAFGRIPMGDQNGTAADLSFTVNFPEIIKADSAAKILSLVVGRAQGALSLKTFAQQWANSVDLGRDYDFDAEMEQIAKEKEMGISLPAMPKNFDTVDPQTPSGGGSELPDPTSANGQQQIRRDDMSPEVEAYLAERGAIVVYP